MILKDPLFHDRVYCSFILCLRAHWLCGCKANPLPPGRVHFFLSSPSQAPTVGRTEFCYVVFTVTCCIYTFLSDTSDSASGANQPPFNRLLRHADRNNWLFFSLGPYSSGLGHHKGSTHCTRRSHPHEYLLQYNFVYTSLTSIVFHFNNQCYNITNLWCHKLMVLQTASVIKVIHL